MRLVGRDLLQQFCREHPPGRSWVQAWTAEVIKARWRTPQEIKERYTTVSFVHGLTIFNVKGNDYRLATHVAYQVGIVQVEWIGTHADYSRINWESRKHEANGRQD